MVHEVTSKESFRKAIQQQSLVVVDFYATWCGPCKAIAPQLEKLAAENPNVSFVKVDVDQVQDVAAESGVNAMPTFFFYKNGEKIDEVIGANLIAIKDRIKKHVASSDSSSKGSTSTAPAATGDKALLIEMVSM